MTRADADAWASASLRRSSPFAWWILRGVCPPAGFVAFARVYGYFRWADDIVDAPGRDPARVAAFVTAQRALVAGERAPVDAPEAALCHALSDPIRGAALAPIVTGMWEALAFDAARGRAPISGDALDRQVAHVGDAYLSALWSCSGAPGAPPTDLFALSRAATLTHVLRDLEVDLALGYTNVPPGVDISDPRALAAWVRTRCDDAEAWFVAGARALPRVRPWRTRWLVGLFAWRYRRVLAGVRHGYRCESAPPVS